MTAPTDPVPDCTFDALERAQLRGWIGLSSGEKVEFFEEMVQLAYQSGALAPERLALRDAPTAPSPLPPSR
jgi:hypothetical protein